MLLINNFIELFIISAPWLLLGLFIAALYWAIKIVIYIFIITIELTLAFFS